MKTSIVSYGMGVDSTALLCLLKQQNTPPDLVIFADTGGEKPETYHYKKIIEEWLLDNSFPPLVTVKNKRNRAGVECDTLEQHCLAGGKLPSIAYGKKACSLDWKKTPVEKFIKQAGIADPLFLISYNYDELRRAIPRKNCTYPLIENKISRLDCLSLIVSEGLPVPAKSACFFCPSSKKSEILALNRLHPELAQRAINMEQKAEKRIQSTSQTIGLGRHFKWGDVVSMAEKQINLLPQDSSLYCDCVEQGVSIEKYWTQFKN